MLRYTTKQHLCLLHIYSLDDIKNCLLHICNVCFCVCPLGVMLSLWIISIYSPPWLRVCVSVWMWRSISLPLSRVVSRVRVLSIITTENPKSHIYEKKIYWAFNVIFFPSKPRCSEGPFTLFCYFLSECTRFKDVCVSVCVFIFCVSLHLSLSFGWPLDGSPW